MSPHAPSPVLLSAWSTLGVGGPAERMFHPDDEATLIERFERADREAARVLILGGGSNIVFDDAGFDGWVIQPALTSLAFEERSPSTVNVRAGAGLAWDAIVAAAVERGLSGIEAMSGIPGHVGAAPIQNIGAYGQELSNTLRRVRSFDRQTKQIVEFSAEQCAFSYRSSVFKRRGDSRYVILGIELRLTRSEAPIPLRYKDLREFFDDEHAPTPAAVRDAVLAIRAKKGMVYDPDQRDSHSVGSFFMNPIVDAEAYQALASKAGALGHGQMPHYMQDDGREKLSAAWLISRAGIERGMRQGSAGVSSRHVLAIMNPGEATAKDVRALARRIQDKVKSYWGVALQPEVRIMTPTGLDLTFYDPRE